MIEEIRPLESYSKCRLKPKLDSGTLWILRVVVGITTNGGRGVGDVELLLEPLHHYTSNKVVWRHAVKVNPKKFVNAAQHYRLRVTHYAEGPGLAAFVN